jgi:hypothetical protein
MKVWRGAGTFTRLAGTDRTIHFEAMPPHLAKGTTDLYEVVLFRRLRSAVAAGIISSVRPSGGSIYFLLGTVLHQLLSGPKDGERALFLVNASFGPALEALKLFAQLQATNPIKVTALCQHSEYARGLTVLHRSIEAPGNPVILGTARLGTLPDCLPLAGPPNSLILIDLFKQMHDDIPGLIRRQFGADAVAKPGLMIAGRVSYGRPIPVQNVLNDKNVLASVKDIIETCLSLGLHGSYLLLEDFDRSFFLPFDGRYALMVLCVFTEPRPLNAALGFRPLDAPLESAGRDLVVFQRTETDRNYDLWFDAEMPEVGLEVEPDWKQWADDRKWDPSNVDWTGGTARYDVELFSYHTITGKNDVNARVRRILSLDENGSHASAFGHMMMARLLASSDPTASVYAVLKGIDLVDSEPRAVAFLLAFLRDSPASQSFEKPRRSEESEWDRAALTDVLRALRESGFGPVFLAAERLAKLGERAFGAESRRHKIFQELLDS